MADAVKVAVRVRPFNAREIAINSKLVLKMDGQKTTITDPSTDQPRDFSFDYSYWSFDKNDAHFVDNTRVFNDLGTIVLNNAWEGYNVCLFAYGQTGSGKSYSMVGYGTDRGIVPLALEEMFARIERNTDPNVKYQVEASMMEIYNEKVRDLFNPDNNPPSGLKVRDHPKLGPYVEDLSAALVGNYADIERLMAEGTAARTVAATQMNNSSSRAHTIFQIILTVTTFDVTTQKSMSRVSKINLVDLAGSERVAKTGATGQQMKEGININKSLSVLGDCIEKLAKRGKQKDIHVPYRNSILTWLLKQSLGGNARTIMIAALSPASDNFEETLSTLRYADRAKQICNSAVVNEDENAKIIRALKKEIEALKAQLAGGGPLPVSATGGVLSDEERKKREEEQAELEKMKERMKQNEEIMRRMNMTWEEKMKESQANADRRAKLLGAHGEARKTTPHLLNLHQDAMLSETLSYFFPEGKIRICTKDAEPAPGPDDIILKGLLILKEHAEITNTGNADGKVVISPFPEARVFVNGTLIKEMTELKTNDRVILGAHHVFRFCHPVQNPPDPSITPETQPYNWQFAQKELTEKAMSSLSPLMDEETKKAKEEAEMKMRELEAVVEREKTAFLKAQQEKQLEYERKVQEIAAQREREMAEARKRLDEEVDAKAQAEIKAKLEERQREMEAEKQRAHKEFEAQSSEMKKREAELERRLVEQQKLTESLHRKREIENRDKVLMEETLMRTIPMVNEANAMSDELKQNLRFSIKLLAKKSTDAAAFTEKTDVFTKVTDIQDGTEVFWDLDTFTENLFNMRELYNVFLEEGNVKIPDGEANPFRIVADGPQLLGNCRIYLQPNYYLFPIEEKTPIIDYKGEAQGQLHVKLLPIPQKTASDDESDSEKDDKDKKKAEKDKAAKAGAGGGDDGEDDAAATEDLFFDEENVEELKGQVLELRLELPKAMGLPTKFSSQVHCVYKFFLDEREEKSAPCKESSINPVLGYSRTIIIDPVSDEFIEYLKSGLMEIQVWGQRPSEDEKKATADRIAHGGPTAAGGDVDKKELEEIRHTLQVLGGHHAHGKSISEQVNSLVTTLKIQIDPNAEPASPVNFGNFSASASPLPSPANKGHSDALQEIERLKAELAAKTTEIERLKPLAHVDGKADAAGNAAKGLVDKSEFDKLQQMHADLLKQNQDMQRKLATQNNSKACIIL